MAWTKQDIIRGALAEIGVAAYDFDLTPDQQQEALRRLDGVIAEFTRTNVLFPYAVPSSPDGGTITDDSGVPDWAIEAVRLSLACRIAPSYGKQAMPGTIAERKTAMNALYARQPIPEKSLDVHSVPAGAGTIWRGGWPENIYLTDTSDSLADATGGAAGANGGEA